MKAVQLFKIGDFRVVDVPKPVPKGDQILVQVGSCGICGSDIPRIFELGTSKQKYPLTIGHEFCGEIVEVGEKVDKKNIGKRGAIFPCIPCKKCDPCLSGHYAMCEDYDYLGSRSDGGFSEYCLVPSLWHFVESNNNNLSDEELSMVEPCTVAQHAIRRSDFTAGNSILIFGAGPIGQMAANWAKIFGASLVVLVDVVEEKVEFARKQNHIVLNSTKVDIKEEFKKINNQKLPDVIIEGTGSGNALCQAIECCKTFGTIVLMGNPNRDTNIKLSDHSLILRKELNIKGSWNSHYNNSPINEWYYTVKMLDEEKMKVKNLITHKSNLNNLPKLCEDIYKKNISICKAIYSKNEK
ncbi:MAG: galactitol-1-phosphate 5-dehydrogenase [Eubacteriales bacterium]|nr:galactitol-1-phosphate 5-dehydrogenase [Eubacteriales bacterium]